MLRKIDRLWMCATLFLAAAGACSEKGRSLVRIHVEADGNLGPLAKVRVVASQKAASAFIADKLFNWTAGPNDLGLYLEKNIAGTVMVDVIGRDAAGTEIAMSESGPEPVDVEAGAVSQKILMFKLIPRGPTAGNDAGTDAGTDAPPSGSGGAGGSGGSSNASGGAGGTATAAGGRGGTAQTNGGAGATASGGAMGGTNASTGGAGGASGGRGGGGGGGGGAMGGPMWRGPQMVEPDILFDDWTPSAAVDQNGNAVLVYRHGPGIRASRFNVATNAWSAPVAVESRAGQAYSPTVLVDKSGRWLVIWQQAEGMPLQGIWQSTSADGTTWTAPGAITTVPAFEPELAMNGDGAAAAAWYGRAADGTFVMTASVRTAIGAAWTSPTVLKPSNTANGMPQHKVAMSGTGEVFVAWVDSDDSPMEQNSIWMRRFAAGVWAPVALLETYVGGPSDAVNVAANAAGEAVITWRQSGATTEDMMARRYSPAGGLTPAASLGQGVFLAWDPPPSVTLDDTGVATVAWAFEVQGRFNVFVNRAAAGQPWPAQPTALETDNQAAAVNSSLTESAKPAPIVRSDNLGNAVVVWRKRVGTRFDLWSRRFSAGAWGAPALLETMDQDPNGVFYPALGMGPGTAVAAWYYQAENRIWANVLR